MDSAPVKPPQDAATVRRLRLGIGVVGIGLPIVLPVGNALLTGRFTLLESISGYYHTGMRDVFVGSMCAIGVFLISYRYRRLDDLLGTVAGVLAIVVALFPATTDAPAGSLSGADVAIGRVHGVAAAALFVLLAVFCLVLFPMGGRSGGVNRGARVRNGVYRTCGAIILVAIVLGLASTALPASVADTVRPLFWCEAVAVLAFGVAWLVKGEAVFRDARDAGVATDGLPAPDPDRAAQSATGAPAGP